LIITGCNVPHIASDEKDGPGCCPATGVVLFRVRFLPIGTIKYVATVISPFVVFNRFRPINNKLNFSDRFASVAPDVAQRSPQSRHSTSTDDGKGLPDGFDLTASPGLGGRIIGGLVKQLNGTMSTASSTIGATIQSKCRQAESSMDRATCRCGSKTLILLRAVYLCRIAHLTRALPS
jgi:hypothetical protein